MSYEQLQTSAQYASLQMKIDWLKKSQNMPVWLSKMVLAYHCCAICWGQQTPQQSLTPAREKCNT
jgi:hypothetical protein